MSQLSLAGTGLLFQNLAEYENLLREIEPATKVVRERHLLRITHLLFEETGKQTYNPDRGLWLSHSQLVELDVLPADSLPSEKEVLLLNDPRDRFKQPVSAQLLLRDAWQLLLRAKLWHELDRNLPNHPEWPTLWAELILSVGRPVERDIEFILESENLITSEAEPEEITREFLAWAGTIALLTPQQLPMIFPGFDTIDKLESTIAALIGQDPHVLKAATKPTGYLEAVPEAEPLPTQLPDLPAEHSVLPTDRQVKKAKKADRLGNHVRAAILRFKAAKSLPREERLRAEGSALSAFKLGLTHPLGRILGWSDDTSKDWAESLVPLLRVAGDGIWPRAARALYDLQKIVGELSDELYTVDPIECLITLGRKPIRRPLARARNVMLLKQLNSAKYHIDRVTLELDQRERLEELIDKEIERTQRRIREELKPIFEDAFQTGGLITTNRLEEIARDKVIDELLDRICSRGYLRLADLRDALARNQLKMQDLQGPLEFIGGDALLRTDKLLGDQLDGIYRRGEIYLRAIHRMNALAFANGIGRWLTKYIFIPFGGAFMIVEFARYLAHEAEALRSFIVDVGPLPAPEEGDSWLESFTVTTADEVGEQAIDTEEADPSGELNLIAPETSHINETEVVAPVYDQRIPGEDVALEIFLIGFLLLGLIHSPRFRNFCWNITCRLGSMLHSLVVTIPLTVWRSPLMLAIRRHPVSRFIYRHFGTAIMWAVIAALWLTVLGYGPKAVFRYAGSVFVLVALVVNTPFGRAMEDRLSEWWSDTWKAIRVNLIPGIIAWIIWSFRWLAGFIERGLYAVDEWLRYREGQSSPSFLIKAVLAVIWFPIAYLIRFGFNLLLEPQINPVKHFPVVTVSHKLLLPLIPSLATALSVSIETSAIIIGSIPGIFGFIVWELKENWRLYAANRSERYPKAVIGHHGETVRALLRPGFHSGTVPKIYRSIRTKVRDAALSGKTPLLSKHWHELIELQDNIQLSIQRDLIPLLTSFEGWAKLQPNIATKTPTTQNIVFKIGIATNDEPIKVHIQHKNNHILAEVQKPEWFYHLSGDIQKHFDLSLQILFESLSVDMDYDETHVAEAEAGMVDPWQVRVAHWERVR